MSRREKYLKRYSQEDWEREYDYVGGFHEGVSRVRKGSEYGFVNKEGEEVVPLGLYDFVNEFSEGLVAVEKGGKQGYLNREGEEVIPLIYDDAFRKNKQETLYALVIG